MREINMKSMEGLVKLGVVGGKHDVTESGEPPWKGMPKFARLVTPLILYRDDQQTRVLLVDYILVLGVASTDGVMLDTSGDCQMVARDREGMGENGMA
jgi:hypothetical protein